MKWTNVKDELPDYTVWVLMYWVGISSVKVKYGTMFVGLVSECEKGMYWDGENYHPLLSITHWMPLPDKPEEAI